MSSSSAFRDYFPGDSNDEAWDAERPMRERAISLGPELSDPDAAADCRCVCHPRPAYPGIHEGGAMCHCQTPLEEFRAHRDEIVSRLHTMFIESETHCTELEAKASAHATSLGAIVSYCGGSSPFVLRGRVDGRAFFLRSRHEQYQVVIAPDATPMDDPWCSLEGGMLTVHSGFEDELKGLDGRLDPVLIVNMAVRAVRSHFLRLSCRHETSVSGMNFCPVCGLPVSPELGLNPFQA